MRYRQLTASGDYAFGQSLANFFINTPAAVAQAVRTRLLLLQGEWFLDNTAGTPYNTQILGVNTKPLYDLAIKEVILDTQGVVDIVNYSSSLSPKRQLTMNVTINTLYGETQVTQVL